MKVFLRKLQKISKLYKKTLISEKKYIYEKKFYQVKKKQNKAYSETQISNKTL